jgi:hypothetical protein
MAALLALLSSLTIGCSRDRALDHRLDSCAAELSRSFDAAFRNTAALAAHFSAAQNKFAPAQEELQSLDRANGGSYRMFDGVQYFNPDAGDVPAVIATGRVPLGYAVRRDILLIERNRERLMQGFRSVPFAADAWLITANSVFARYPHREMISGFKPGTDVLNLFWWKLPGPAANPSRSAIWIPEPFISIAGSGWLAMPVAPVYDGETFAGVAAISLQLERLTDAIIRNREEAIILVSNRTLVVAKSDGARRLFPNIPVISEYYYLKQMDSHPEVRDQFRLSHINNTESIRALGDRIVAGTDFIITLEGIRVRCTTRRIKGPDLILAGFERE